MQTYTTQMDAARKGIVTPQMETVAKKEYRTVEEIRQLVAEGKVAIPANKHHECLNYFCFLFIYWIIHLLYFRRHDGPLYIHLWAKVIMAVLWLGTVGALIRYSYF